MLEFVIVVALLGVVVWWSWYQTRKQLARYYVELAASEEVMNTTETQGESAETDVKENLPMRPCPSNKKILICIVLSTILNIALMALSYFFYSDSIVYAFKLAVVFQWIVAIAIIDYHCYVIPNGLLLQGLGVSVLFILLEVVSVNYSPMVTLKDYGIGLVIGGGVFLLSALVSRGSIGMGDVKMFSVLGLFMGTVGVFNLLFFTVFASAICSVVLLLRKKGDKKTMLPLGPFTYVGMLIVILAGI